MARETGKKTRAPETSNADYRRNRDGLYGGTPEARGYKSKESPPGGARGQGQRSSKPASNPKDGDGRRRPSK